MNKLRWHRREWNAVECAKEIVEAFEKLHRSAESTQGIQAPINNDLPPTTLELAYQSNRALEKIDAGQIDICIISLQPPSMLHRLSSTSTSIHDLKQYLKGFSIDASILLVDGNDNDNFHGLLEKDRFLRISSLVFIGEGIVDNSWTSSKTESSPIFDLVDRIKVLSSLPKVSIGFKYGANAFKTHLKHNGFPDVEVWDNINCIRAAGGLLESQLLKLRHSK